MEVVMSDLLKKVHCPDCGNTFFPRKERRHKCTKCGLYFFSRVEIVPVKCKKCRHEWTPRSGVVKRCPKCGSTRWNCSDTKWQRMVEEDRKKPKKEREIT